MTSTIPSRPSRTRIAAVIARIDAVLASSTDARAGRHRAADGADFWSAWASRGLTPRPHAAHLAPSSELLMSRTPTRRVDVVLHEIADHIHHHPRLCLPHTISPGRATEPPLITLPSGMTWSAAPVLGWHDSMQRVDTVTVEPTIRGRDYVKVTVTGRLRKGGQTVAVTAVIRGLDLPPAAPGADPVPLDVELLRDWQPVGQAHARRALEEASGTLPNDHPGHIVVNGLLLATALGGRAGLSMWPTTVRPGSAPVSAGAR